MPAQVHLSSYIINVNFHINFSVYPRTQKRHGKVFEKRALLCPVSRKESTLVTARF